MPQWCGWSGVCIYSRSGGRRAGLLASQSLPKSWQSLSKAFRSLPKASPKPPKVSPKPPPRLPESPQSLPKSPQRVPRGSPRLPKGSPKSASFFLLLSDSCFHPFCKHHHLYSRYSHWASDFASHVWPILRSLCWVLGCSESHFHQKTAQTVGGTLFVESHKTLFCLVFCLLGPPISLHIFALTQSLVLQNCPCVQPIVVCFLPIAVEVWGVRNRIFRQKNSPNQPKLCEVPRWWNHIKRCFCLVFFCSGLQCRSTFLA